MAPTLRKRNKKSKVVKSEQSKEYIFRLLRISEHQNLNTNFKGNRWETAYNKLFQKWTGSNARQLFTKVFWSAVQQPNLATIWKKLQNHEFESKEDVEAELREMLSKFYDSGFTMECDHFNSKLPGAMRKVAKSVLTTDDIIDPNESGQSDGQEKIVENQNSDGGRYGHVIKTLEVALEKQRARLHQLQQLEAIYKTASSQNVDVILNPEQEALMQSLMNRETAEKKRSMAIPPKSTSDDDDDGEEEEFYEADSESVTTTQNADTSNNWSFVSAVMKRFF